MNEPITAYSLPGPVDRFPWRQFAGQEDRVVTYVYVTRPAVPRMRGESSILYIGQTEQSIAKRVDQEMRARNTVGNTQNTNIRMSAVLSELQRARHSIATYFTPGLTFTPSAAELETVLSILQVWDKRAWVQFTQRQPAAQEFEIEKFLLCHYAVVHLELPPLNNAM
jgi:hypothetical protein